MCLFEDIVVGVFQEKEGRTVDLSAGITVTPMGGDLSLDGSSFSLTGQSFSKSDQHWHTQPTLSLPYNLISSLPEEVVLSVQW